MSKELPDRLPEVDWSAIPYSAANLNEVWAAIWREMGDTGRVYQYKMHEDIGSPGEPAPEEVRDYITAETDLTVAEVENAATTRSEACKYLTELSAYYLVALDHGLRPAEVFETVQRSYSLDITNLQPEMNSVDLTAEIAQITSINTFERDDGSDGRVCNVIVADETDRCVLTLWDDTTALVNNLKNGATVRIENGYSKVASDYCQDRLGCDVEVRLGDTSALLQRQDGDWVMMKE